MSEELGSLRAEAAGLLKISDENPANKPEPE